METATGTFDVDWDYDYSASGQIEGVTNSRGAQSSLVVDGAGAVIEAIKPNGTKDILQYDSRGFISGMSQDGSEFIEVSNNALGSPVDVTIPNGPTVNYEYDALGRQTRITYSTGESIEYFYDAAGRKVKEIDADGQKPVTYTTRWVGEPIQYCPTGFTSKIASTR